MQASFHSCMIIRTVMHVPKLTSCIVQYPRCVSGPQHSVPQPVVIASPEALSIIPTLTSKNDVNMYPVALLTIFLVALFCTWMCSVEYHHIPPKPYVDTVFVFDHPFLNPLGDCSHVVHSILL